MFVFPVVKLVVICFYLKIMKSLCSNTTAKVLPLELNIHSVTVKYSLVYFNL